MRIGVGTKWSCLCVFAGFVSIVKKLDRLVSIRLGLHIQQQIILQLEWSQMSTTERFERMSRVWFSLCWM